MRHHWTVAIGLLLGLNLLAAEAGAQMNYPGGYGGYGMSQWGSSPEAGLMAGLGAFGRGKGVYLLDKAQADSIKTDTMIKWNKALRARQAALRADQKKEAAEKETEREARLEERRLKDGTTLNDLLYEIFDADPAVVKSAAAKAPISPAAIREIPFEWASEAITACIDQMTGTAGLPPLLMDPKYVDQRDALRSAVEPALKEDARGDVSRETRRRVDRAVADFRAKFMKNTADYQPGYVEALDYFTTLASLNRMLHDPSMKKFLSQLEEGKERTVGDLIAFMHAYNLRFGPAQTERQVEIYTRLVPILTKLRDDVDAEPGKIGSLDKTGEGMKPAAQQAFKGMKWDQLEAHSREQ